MESASNSEIDFIEFQDEPVASFTTAIYNWKPAHAPSHNSKKQPTQTTEEAKLEEQTEEDESDTWWYSDAYTPQAKYDKWYENYLYKHISMDRNNTTKKRGRFTNPSHGQYDRMQNVGDLNSCKPQQMCGDEQWKIDLAALIKDEQNKKQNARKIGHVFEDESQNDLNQDSLKDVENLASDIMDQAVESIRSKKSDFKCCLTEQQVPDRTSKKAQSPQHKGKLTVLETLFQVPIDLEAYTRGSQTKTPEPDASNKISTNFCKEKNEGLSSLIPISKSVKDINKSRLTAKKSRIPRLITTMKSRLE